MNYYREPQRPANDPLLSGVEAVAAGYRTVEHVFDAFAESLRRRPTTRYERGAPPPQRYRGAATRPVARQSAPAGPQMAPGSGPKLAPGGGYGTGQSSAPVVPSSGLAHLVVELFDLFGEIVDGLVGGIGEEIFGEEVHRLEPPPVAPGETTKLRFRFTNTGSAALEGLGFSPTPLLDGAEKIDPGAIKFPNVQVGTRVEPNSHISVDMQVAVPANQPLGTYRGVVVATSTPAPGLPSAEPSLDAWALVEVRVGVPDVGTTGSIDDEPE